ncbi:M6 family metalloprotease domain-containing protein, partial [Bacteroides salyersiae]
MKRYPILWIVVLFFPLLLSAAEKNKGKLSNLVCFLRFNDEDNKEQFDKPISYYETMFNAEVEGANSVYGYFREASYNQLFWKSSFFPKSDGTQIISYKAKNERGYYREKNSINDLGYSNETEKAAREQALIKELAAYLSENLPDDVVIDANNDGLLDNICIIVSGNSDLSSKYMLWPHRSDLALPDEKAIYVKGKKIVGYLMVFNDANGWSSLSPVPLNTGVLCHEMSHTLGTYDLYHVNDNLNPVGVWDLMSDNLTTPQQMSAYTKYRYCKWIDEIPEISTPGTYTLNPVGGTTKENIAYKIKPTGSDEYFIVEYRRKDGTFDRGLPSSGLLVYRINPNVTGGNLNYNGTTRLDEQYLFRPGGTVTLDGDISKAAFSAESGRTAIGGNAELKPFYSDGKEAKFALANISSCGETISFDLLELTPQIYIPKPNVTLGGTINSTAQVIVESDVAWRIVDVPDWLTITPLQGEAGQSTIVLQAKSANENAQLRIADFHLQGVEDPSITAIVNVAQRSDLIQSPSALTAKEEGNTVVLTWVAPHEGTPALMEDFEDSGNLAKWTIKNEGNRGWLWQKNEKYKEPYAGNYSMRLLEAWEDIH